MKKRYIALGAFGLLIFAAAIAPKPTPEQIAVREARSAKAAKVKAAAKASEQVKERRETLIYASRGIISQQLRDPSSARFGKIYIGDKEMTCGEVQGKNGFGGYSNRMKFMIAGRLAMIDDNSKDFAKLWNISCIRNVYESKYHS